MINAVKIINMLIGCIYCSRNPSLKKTFDRKDQRELIKTCDLITVYSYASKMHEQLLIARNEGKKIK